MFEPQFALGDALTAASTAPSKPAKLISAPYPKLIPWSPTSRHHVAQDTLTAKLAGRATAPRSFSPRVHQHFAVLAAWQH